MAYMQFYNWEGYTKKEAEKFFESGVGMYGVSSHACFGSMPGMQGERSTISIGASLSSLISVGMLQDFVASLVKYFPAAKLRILAADENDNYSNSFRVNFSFPHCNLLYSLIDNDEWIHLYGDGEAARKARLMYHTFLRCPQENAGVFLMAYVQFKKEGEKEPLLWYILQNQRFYHARKDKYLSLEVKHQYGHFRANYTPGSGHGFCDTSAEKVCRIPYSVDQMLATAIYGGHNMNNSFSLCAYAEVKEAF